MSERVTGRWLIVGLVVVAIAVAFSRLGGSALDALRRMHGH